MNPLFFLLAIAVILAWKNAGWWGLDRFILPALSRPGHKGSMFKRRAAVVAPPGLNSPDKP